MTTGDLNESQKNAVQAVEPAVPELTLEKGEDANQVEEMLYKNVFRMMPAHARKTLNTLEIPNMTPEDVQAAVMKSFNEIVREQLIGFTSGASSEMLDNPSWVSKVDWTAFIREVVERISGPEALSPRNNGLKFPDVAVEPSEGYAGVDGSHAPQEHWKALKDSENDTRHDQLLTAVARGDWQSIALLLDSPQSFRLKLKSNKQHPLVTCGEKYIFAPGNTLTAGDEFWKTFRILLNVCQRHELMDAFTTVNELTRYMICEDGFISPMVTPPGSPRREKATPEETLPFCQSMLTIQTNLLSAQTNNKAHHRVVEIMPNIVIRNMTPRETFESIRATLKGSERRWKIPLEKVDLLLMEMSTTPVQATGTARICTGVWGTLRREAEDATEGDFVKLVSPGGQSTSVHRLVFSAAFKAKAKDTSIHVPSSPEGVAVLLDLLYLGQFHGEATALVDAFAAARAMENESVALELASAARAQLPLVTLDQFRSLYKKANKNNWHDLRFALESLAHSRADLRLRAKSGAFNDIDSGHLAATFSVFCMD